MSGPLEMGVPRDTSVTCTLAFSTTDKAGDELEGGHHVLISTDYDTVIVIKDSQHGILVMGDCTRSHRRSNVLLCARVTD